MLVVADGDGCKAVFGPRRLPNMSFEELRTRRGPCARGPDPIEARARSVVSTPYVLDVLDVSRWSRSSAAHPNDYAARRDLQVAA
jgi:hypothetical protein